MTSEVDVGTGFALDEYICVRNGPLGSVIGGTMAKAAYAPGGMTDELKRNQDKAPGPGTYFKETGVKLFSARGTIFSKLSRDGGKKSKESRLAPGDYDVKTPRKVKGGLMSRNDRICAFAKMAERTNQWNKNGPGQYDTNIPQRNTPSPTFSSIKSASRAPPKPSPVGPGYYNPDYRHVDRRPPSFSGSKEETKDYMMRVNKDRISNPFANYKDMPESKFQDRIGTKKHCKRLLHDRKITPRQRQYEVSPRDLTAIELDLDVAL
jgi:hypothetical protein